MDKKYELTLTPDELDTIYRALWDREDRYRKEAKETGNPDTHFLKQKLANKSAALIEKINILRARYW